MGRVRALSAYIGHRSIAAGELVPQRRERFTEPDVPERAIDDRSHYMLSERILIAEHDVARHRHDQHLRGSEAAAQVDIAAIRRNVFQRTTSIGKFKIRAELNDLDLALWMCFPVMGRDDEKLDAGVAKRTIARIRQIVAVRIQDLVRQRNARTNALDERLKILA